MLNDSEIHRPRTWLALALVSTVALAGCSTRQVSPTLEGSTAQRLVTYSLDQFIAELATKPQISELQGQSVALRVNFVDDHPLLDYATQLISARMYLIHGIRVAGPEVSADHVIDVFFNSIGTDSDDFGLSLPSFGLVPSAESINILALDMYHGITEGYAIVTSTETGAMEQTDRVLARVRRDNVSTPIIDFPLNQLD